MPFLFDVDSIVERDTGFYVAIGTGKTPAFSQVVVGNDVRTALVDAVRASLAAMRELSPQPEQYDPSNVYDQDSYLSVPLDDVYVEKARYIHEIANPEIEQHPLDVLPRISMYIARLFDSNGNRLSAVKKVSQFSRSLGRAFLARLTNNELHLVTEPQFQLSNEFDFLISDSEILIFHPKAFEGACNLQGAVTGAMQSNIDFLAERLGYIDFSRVPPSVARSVRAARELAAIRRNGYCDNLDPNRIVQLCETLEINYSIDDVGETMSIDEESFEKFIKLLSRRYLSIHIRSNDIETFEAPSRKPYNSTN